MAATVCVVTAAIATAATATVGVFAAAGVGVTTGVCEQAPAYQDSVVNNEIDDTDDANLMMTKMIPLLLELAKMVSSWRLADGRLSLLTQIAKRSTAGTLTEILKIRTSLAES